MIIFGRKGISVTRRHALTRHQLISRDCDPTRLTPRVRLVTFFALDLSVPSYSSIHTTIPAKFETGRIYTALSVYMCSVRQVNTDGDFKLHNPSIRFHLLILWLIPS